MPTIVTQFRLGPLQVLSPLNRIRNLTKHPVLTQWYAKSASQTPSVKHSPDRYTAIIPESTTTVSQALAKEGEVNPRVNYANARCTAGNQLDIAEIHTDCSYKVYNSLGVAIPTMSSPHNQKTLCHNVNRDDQIYINFTCNKFNGWSTRFRCTHRSTSPPSSVKIGTTKMPFLQSIQPRLGLT